MPATSALQSSHPSPLLPEIVERFSTNTGQISDLISSIQDKLHGIVDKRQPVSKSGEDSGGVPTDFIQAMSGIEMISQRNLNRLRDVLDHLNSLL